MTFNAFILLILYNLFCSYNYKSLSSWQHSIAVVRTVASQREALQISSLLGFPCGVCMFT